MNTRDTELIFEAYRERVIELNAYEAECVMECLVNRAIADSIIEEDITSWAIRKGAKWAAKGALNWLHNKTKPPKSQDSIPSSEDNTAKEKILKVLTLVNNPREGMLKAIEIGLQSLSSEEVAKVIQSHLNPELIRDMVNLQRPGLGDEVYKTLKTAAPAPRPIPKNIPRPYFPSPFEIDNEDPRQLSTESVIIRRDLIRKIENDIIYSLYN
jgi:hypothetical protein